MVFRREGVFTDPEAVSTMAERVGLRVGAASEDPDFSCRFSQVADEQVAIWQMELHGAVSFWGDTEVFAVSDARGIRYDWHNREEAGTAIDTPVLFRPGLPGLVVAEGLRSTNVCVPVPLVQSTANAVYGTDTPVRFTSSAPENTQLGRTWSHLARYGLGVLNSEAYDEPLVRAALTRYLAVGLLECFQLAGDRQALHLSMKAQTRWYRTAVQFFDDFASLPITVEDAARAAETTTAALVQAFRANHPRQLTPAQYLRHTRLPAAHRDLVSADPTAGDTVQKIAARWGFVHPGRFTAAYRDMYGTRPRDTLHR